MFFMMLDTFNLADFELRYILVSFPMQRTTQRILSVFLMLQPLRNILASDIDLLSPAISRVPSHDSRSSVLVCDLMIPQKLFCFMFSVNLGSSFCLRLVSPSSCFVSTYANPSSYEVLSTSKSAGTAISFTISTTSPIFTSYHVISSLYSWSSLPLFSPKLISQYYLRF